MKRKPSRRQLRSDAAWLLYQILEVGRSARDCMPDIQAGYEQPRDRAWLNEVVLGILRQLPVYQTQLRQFLDKPLKGDKKVIEHLIMVGFYQLSSMRVSPHAAINETVNATQHLGAGSLKKLVNAILRRHQREGWHDEDNLRNRAGLPGWLFKAISTHYPDQAEQIISHINGKAPIWLRANTQKLSRDDLSAAFVQQGIESTSVESHPDALQLVCADITTLPGFDQGWFSVQDGAAQLVAPLINPQEGEHILDCCAAPGGKTSHLFSLSPDSALIALDSDASRITKINENFARLGVNAKVVCGDATTPNEWWDGQQFDKILIDAPCSATGIIRRHPDIRWLRQASDIPKLVDLQAKILDAMWTLLKPGGQLVYATCSILPEENTQQIAHFLHRHQDAQSNLQERQILPGEQQMDGFYFTRLVKSA